MSAPIRVLLSKPTHDVHDRGVRYLIGQLRDAGFEVIFTNFLLPEEVVSTAIQEDVQVVGISSSTGGHMPVFEDISNGLKAEALGDVMLIGGGIIPHEDQEVLKETMGVKAIMGPGSTAQETIDLINNWVGEQRKAADA